MSSELFQSIFLTLGKMNTTRNLQQTRKSVLQLKSIFKAISTYFLDVRKNEEKQKTYSILY